MSKKLIASYWPDIIKLWKGNKKEIELKVSGTSMLPFIEPGDYAISRKVETSALTPGDIIYFWRNDKVVIHRFIQKKYINGKLMLCEKGDNKLSWSWIEEECYIAKVFCLRRDEKLLHLDTLSEKRKARFYAKISLFWICFLSFIFSIKNKISLPHFCVSRIKKIFQCLHKIMYRVLHRSKR